MSQVHQQLQQPPKQVNLPTFVHPAAVQQLTGLTLKADALISELTIRGYSPAECLFVVCREVNQVLAVEYELLIEQATRGLPLALFSATAGLRERATARSNARIELILASRLPPMPVLLTAGDAQQQLPLNDALLTAVRGYKLLADPQNKSTVSVQIGGATKQLGPGGELLVKTLDEPVFVSGASQLIRWARVPQVERSGTLADALPLPDSKPVKRSLLSRMFGSRA